MTEYHKIETVYERDPKTFKVIPSVLRNPVYRLIKESEFTEKIDGTNIRCIWQEGKLTFGGKTDSAQIHSDLVRWLYDNVSAEKLAEVFPDTTAVIYGEGYGAGIQKGETTARPRSSLSSTCWYRVSGGSIGRIPAMLPRSSTSKWSR